jgi:hypothetical protein
MQPLAVEPSRLILPTLTPFAFSASPLQSHALTLSHFSTPLPPKLRRPGFLVLLQALRLRMDASHILTRRADDSFQFSPGNPMALPERRLDRLLPILRLQHLVWSLASPFRLVCA